MLWPVVEAAQQDDSTALGALLGVVGGIGSNLLTTEIQTWKDGVDAAEQLARTAEESGMCQRRRLTARIRELGTRLSCARVASERHRSNGAANGEGMEVSRGGGARLTGITADEE